MPLIIQGQLRTRHFLLCLHTKRNYVSIRSMKLCSKHDFPVALHKPLQLSHDLSNSAMSCHSLSFGTLKAHQWPSVASPSVDFTSLLTAQRCTTTILDKWNEATHNYLQNGKTTMMCEPFSARLCCTFSGFKGEFKVPEVTCKRNGTKSNYKKNARAKVDLCCSKAAFMLTFEFTNRFDIWALQQALPRLCWNQVLSHMKRRWCPREWQVSMSES